MLSCPILDYLSTYGKINPQNSKIDNEKCLPTAVQRKDTYIMGAIVTLKKGEGRLLKSGGAWIFDNEVDTIVGSFENGDIVIVKDFDGYPLGKGFIFFLFGLGIAGCTGNERIFVILIYSLLLGKPWLACLLPTCFSAFDF